MGEFDKNFFSKENFEDILLISIIIVVMKKDDRKKKFIVIEFMCVKLINFYFSFMIKLNCEINSYLDRRL